MKVVKVLRNLCTSAFKVMVGRHAMEFLKKSKSWLIILLLVMLTVAAHDLPTVKELDNYFAIQYVSLVIGGALLVCYFRRCANALECLTSFVPSKKLSATDLCGNPKEQDCCRNSLFFDGLERDFNMKNSVDYRKDSIVLTYHVYISRPKPESASPLPTTVNSKECQKDIAENTSDKVIPESKPSQTQSSDTTQTTSSESDSELSQNTSISESDKSCCDYETVETSTHPQQKDETASNSMNSCQETSRQTLAKNELQSVLQNTKAVEQDYHSSENGRPIETESAKSDSQKLSLGAKNWEDRNKAYLPGYRRPINAHIRGGRVSSCPPPVSYISLATPNLGILTQPRGMKKRASAVEEIHEHKSRSDTDLQGSYSRTRKMVEVLKGQMLSLKNLHSSKKRASGKAEDRIRKSGTKETKAKLRFLPSLCSARTKNALSESKPLPSNSDVLLEPYRLSRDVTGSYSPGRIPQYGRDYTSCSDNEINTPYTAGSYVFGQLPRRNIRPSVPHTYPREYGENYISHSYPYDYIAAMASPSKFHEDLLKSYQPFNVEKPGQTLPLKWKSSMMGRCSSELLKDFSTEKQDTKPVVSQFAAITPPDNARESSDQSSTEMPLVYDELDLMQSPLLKGKKKPSVVSNRRRSKSSRRMRKELEQNLDSWAEVGKKLSFSNEENDSENEARLPELRKSENQSLHYSLNSAEQNLQISNILKTI